MIYISIIGKTLALIVSLQVLFFNINHNIKYVGIGGIIYVLSNI